MCHAEYWSRLGLKVRFVLRKHVRTFREKWITFDNELPYRLTSSRKLEKRRKIFSS